MADKKFSQFAPAPSPADEVKRGDILVGLRDSKNYQFDFPGLGIKDASGNYMFQYETMGVLSVNFPQLTNSLTGTPVIYGAEGADPIIDIWIRPHGAGKLILDQINWVTSDGAPGTFIITDGAGNLSFSASPVVSGIIGTASQVLANGTFGVPQGGNVTLTTPQNIAPASSPTFANLTLTNPLTLGNGGTNKALIANNGGIVYTDTNSMEILPGTPSARKMLQSGASAAPAWSTSIWPDTTTINQILYSSTANNVTGITTVGSSMLFTNSSGTPAFSSSLNNGQIMIGATGASPAPATLTAGPGVSISNGPNTITISSVGGGIGWNEVTGITQAMTADSGYVSNNVALVTFTLPLTAAFGTQIIIVGKGAGGWKINNNVGQNIQVGNTSSSVGVGGSVASTNRFDSIELVCTTADTTWTTLSAPQSAGLTIL